MGAVTSGGRGDPLQGYVPAASAARRRPGRESRSDRLLHQAGADQAGADDVHAVPGPAVVERDAARQAE